MLTLNIKQFKYTKEIFTDTSFVAYPKQFTILTGESGAGKSTLLSILACLHEGLFEGSYSIDGKQITEKNRQDMILYVTQHPSFVYDLTIYDNFVFFLEAHGREVDKEEIYYLAKKLNMEDKLNLYPKQLSGGEKQKAAIILALCSKMKVILLDEPTSSLDGESILELIDLFKERNEYLIISTHDERLVEIADRHYHIEDKKIHLLKELEVNEAVDKKIEIDTQKMNLFDLSFILMKQLKYKWVSKVFLLLLSIVSILGLVLAQNLGGEWYKENYIKHMQMYEPLAVVYKSLPGYWDYRENYQLTDSEVLQLYNLKNASFIFPYYRFQSVSNKVMMDNGDIINASGYSAFVDGKMQKVYTGNGNVECIDNNGNVKGVPLGAEYINEHSIGINYYFSTYQEEKDYSLLMKEIYREDGIFISEIIADELNVEKGDSLRVSLFIPTHYILNTLYIEEENTEQPYLSHFGQYIDIIVPVRGVIGTAGDIEMGMFGNGTIYFPYSFYEQLINDYRGNKAFEYKGETFVPYTPNSYVVKSENADLFRKLLTELENINFYEMNGFIAVENALDRLNKATNNMKTMFFGILLGVFIILFTVQYFNRKENTEKMNMFKIIGINPKNQCLLLGMSRLPEYLISLILSFGALPFIIQYLDGQGVIFKTSINISMIVLLLTLNFIVIIVFNVVSTLILKKNN